MVIWGIINVFDLKCMNLKWMVVVARDIPFALVYSSINQNTLEVVRCIIRVSVSCAFFLSQSVYIGGKAHDSSKRYGW